VQDFHGRVAVITGGGSGLGQALVGALAAEGAHVVVADIEGDRAEEVAAAARNAGVRAIAVTTDVSKRDSVQELAERAYAEFGEVHLLFNNAGVISFGPLTTLTEGDWRWMSGVNMDGVVHGLFAFLPRMLEAPGERHIVNTGSIAGLIAVPNQSGYSATKHAIVSLSESLHVELEPHGIGVSVICPGAVATNIVDAVRNRPEALGGRAEGPDEMRARIAAQGMAPDAVAGKVLAGIRAKELYIVTHPANRAAVQARHELLMAAYDRQAGDA
jgi:NAD(P)-dependent dehydrogenase (short-subunit alcohol dehydrogenase family)